ncbi:hypothetical protein [Dactylosporangium salmoneum]
MWRHIDGLSPRECRAVIARFVPDEPGPTPTAAAKIPAVANALHVPGRCVTRSNAVALLELTVVQLSAAERAAVLKAFRSRCFLAPAATWHAAGRARRTVRLRPSGGIRRPHRAPGRGRHVRAARRDRAVTAQGAHPS